MKLEYIEFIKALGNSSLKGAYLFVGLEDYLKFDTIDRIKSKYIDPSFESLNYMEIKGKDKFFKDIENSCETLPFMSDKKLVVVEDINEMISTDSGLSKALSDYIGKIGDQSILILVDKKSKLLKTTSIYKTMKKSSRIVEFNRLRSKDLDNWVKERFSYYGASISPRNLQYFLSQSGYGGYDSNKNLYELENEIKKLANYKKGDLSQDDIDQILVANLDTNIFNLLNSINNGDTSSALRIFKDMKESEEPIPRILFMIIRQLRLIFAYKVYKSQGYPQGEIQRKLKIKTYELKKISAYERSYSMETLKYFLNYLLEMDIKQKTSYQDPALEMEILIVGLSNK